MKNLFLGVVAIILIGIAGLVYRNAAEHPSQQIACPLDALVCPDGTSVVRTGPSCTFSACTFPNVTLNPVGISYAIPEGFASTSISNAATIASYISISTSTEPSSISIRRYPVGASSTPLETIQSTAISGASGAPVSVTNFSSKVLGTHRFTVVLIERFEGIIDTAYYLARTNDVIRFDAIDRGISSWTSPSLDVSALPAHSALLKLLGSLQGQ